MKAARTWRTLGWTKGWACLPARDLLLGLGLLGRPQSPEWRRARFVNDMLDTTLIGAAFARSSNRLRLATFAAIAAGVIVLDARSSLP